MMSRGRGGREYMNCPSCGVENHVGRKFCGECGSRLALHCRACGTPHAAGEKFCGECGAALTRQSSVEGLESRVTRAPSPDSGRQTLNPRPIYTPPHLADKILQSKSALEGERKQVTVLFADVKGSMELAEQTGDPLIQAVIASDAHPFCWTGRLRETVRLTEKAIALGPEDLSLGQELLGISAYLLGLAFRGAALVEMGCFDEATSDLDRAGQYLAEQPSLFIWSQGFHAVRAYRAGDASGALTHARHALERAEDHGPLFQVFAQVVLGIALVANREWSGAEEVERRALALARERGVGFGLTAWALCFLAEVKLGQGDPRAALELADEALADARQSGGRLFEMDALLTRARALLGSEGASCTAEVERTLAEASTLIDETEARCKEPIVHEISSELARLRGDEATRERELREAHRLFVEMGATGHAARVTKEIG